MLRQTCKWNSILTYGILLPESIKDLEHSDYFI